jgi:hypothetical protein
MDLYNKTENEALGNELMELTDKWPNCDQARAVELQVAFDDFSEQGGWNTPEMKDWERPYHDLTYEIKRGDRERLQHFLEAQATIMAESARKRGKQ